MAGKNSPWQGNNKGTGASVEEDATPKFSGDDMEFESFMFDSGELSALSQAAAVATATAPVSAALDAMPPMAGGVMPTSGPLPVEQPALEQDTSFAGANQSDMPAFSLDASGPVDTAPVDPADMFVLPAPQQVAGDISGEDVPLPFHLQTAEPEILPFVPEVSIKPLPARPRSKGALETIPTGPLDQISPSMDGGSSPLQASDAPLDDGWTDASLSVVEDFSSVLLAMQAGSHFPLTTGGAAVLDAQPTGMVEEGAAQYAAPAESSQNAYPDEAPSAQAALQEASEQPEPQALLGPVDALDDGAVMQADPHVTLDSAPPQAEMQQDVAQTAAPMPVMGVTFAAPDEPAEIEEGRFKGADFEFESFMFTSPTPASQEVMPAPTDNTQPATKDLSPESTSTLPFWLQTGELPALPDQPKMDASPVEAAPPHVEAAMPEMKAEAADLVMESAPTLESIQQDVYADIPPIDPFDFSLLQPVEEEERLGFNLQELEGMIPMDRISTKVTTDLSALAEFLGTKSPSDIVKSQTGEDAAVEEAVAAVEVPAREASTEVAAQAEVEASPTPDKGKGKGTIVLGKGTTGLHTQAEDATGSPSWTSTVISAETRAQVEQQAAEPEATQLAQTLEPASDVEAELASMPAESLPVAVDTQEIEIDPFNYTDLDLDDDETATEQLSSMATSAITSTSVLDTGGQPTTPVLRPQQALGGDLASRIPLDTGSFDDENETSFFSSAQPTKKVGAKSTGWLSDSEGQAVVGQPAAGHSAKAKSKTGGAEGGSKARVARGDSRERKRLDTAIVDSSSHESSSETLQKEASAAQQASGPTPGRQAGNYVSSGPLPAMVGFEALHEIADRNPDDLSTQIALASAYAQSGEYDAALRTYRRALKKPTISPAMLEVIAEEISDIEEEAAHLPRFHQVLGDLYMKQGRYKDAIDEYNRIG